MPRIVKKFFKSHRTNQVQKYTPTRYLAPSKTLAFPLPFFSFYFHRAIILAPTSIATTMYTPMDSSPTENR